MYNKVIKADPEIPFRYSPNIAHPGFVNLFNPFKKEEELMNYERIIEGVR